MMGNLCSIARKMNSMRYLLQEWLVGEDIMEIEEAFYNLNLV